MTRTLTPTQRRMQIGLLLIIGLLMLACGVGPVPSSYSGDPNPIAGYNAAYNCPTATPPPPPTPIPTTCVEGTASPDGTPGPEECTKPIPTWTPQPTPTPYGRWASPGDRGTGNLFRRGQNVYIGPLRLTLEGYRTIPLAGGQSVAHAWTLDVANISGSTPFSITWPLQATMRAIAQPDGSTRTGNWPITATSAQAAGNTRLLDPTPERYDPGAHRQVIIPFEGVPGTGVAIGFIPDPTGEGASAAHPGTPTGHGESERPDLAGGSTDIYWFSPQEDPVCSDQNTSGPPRQNDGGAVYSKPRATQPPASYAYTNGWPTVQNATISQGYGCTGTVEIQSDICYRADPSTPYFHSGLDIARRPQGSPLFSVAHDRVSYVGISYGRVCDYGDFPNSNLGWLVQLQAGPWTIKYGHTMLHSEQVHVGQEVAPGDVLAQMGSTGCSTGPHLHFMVQNPSGAFQNPMRFIGPNRTELLTP